MREENPIEVVIGLLWNASIHFMFPVKNRRWDTVTVPNGVSKYKKDLKICHGLIYFDDKTRSFTLFKYVCMYLFATDKKSLKIAHSPILRSVKLSNLIFTEDNSLFSHANKTIFSMINNTEWTLNE